ncbi:MAG: hypothetical protein NTW19_02620 [Planctomycetota bacterium]|nr:hypothetical protein [Planctomycetota bacterium]
MLFVSDASGPAVPASVICLGMVNGFLYATHFFVILICYRLAGVGITLAVTNSGVVLAVLGSHLIWHEPMTRFQWGSLLLFPLAMFLIRPREAVGHPKLGLRGDAALLASFLLAGVVQCIHKGGSMLANNDDHSIHVYQSVVFGGAMATSALWALRTGVRPTRGDALVGIGLGTLNAANLLLVMLALRHLPGVIYFPTSTCAMILLGVACSRWLWREWLTGRQMAGVAATLAVVVLTNVG